MVTAFYIFVFLMIWHIFYESILAPALRNNLKYKFFEIRDQLRLLKIDGLSKSDEEVYDLLDQSICHLIHSMSFLNIVNYLQLRRELINNKEFNIESGKIKSIINNSENENLKIIDEKIARHGGSIFMINSGGWIIYLLLPLLILFIVIILSSQLDRLSRKIKLISSRLIYAPDDLDDNSHIGLA